MSSLATQPIVSFDCLNAEIEVITALIADPAAHAKAGALAAEHFVDPLLADIAQVILNRCRAGQSVSPAEIAGDLRPGALDELGGTRFLDEIKADTDLVIDLAETADFVRICALRRRTLVARGDA